MDIPLNGTFIVQAINFFIVYCILERLLFKPVFAQLTEDHHEHAVLLQQAQSADAKIEALQQLITAQWQQCLHQVHALQPVTFVFRPPPITGVSLKSTPNFLGSKSEATKEIAAYIRKRLERLC